jgi:hypothetical protein
MKYVNGIQISDFAPLPPLKGCGAAIVCGTAPGYGEELAEALRQEPEAYVMGVNRVYQTTAVDCLATVHPEAFQDCPVDLHTDKPGGDWRWPIATRGGTSALLAVCIALMMGFDRVVLAGVHIDGEYSQCRGPWLERRKALSGRICSVSPRGTFTRDTFGGCEDSAAT